MRLALTALLAIAAVPAAAQTAPKPPASAAICGTCHAWQKGVNRIGPSLHGIIGRKVASVPNYKYSAAMLAYGKQNPVWTEQQMFNYLAAPMQIVKGTKMAYAGQKDPKKRQEIIAFLKTLR